MGVGDNGITFTLHVLVPNTSVPYACKYHPPLRTGVSGARQIDVQGLWFLENICDSLERTMKFGSAASYSALMNKGILFRDGAGDNLLVVEHNNFQRNKGLVLHPTLRDRVKTSRVEEFTNIDDVCA